MDKFDLGNGFVANCSYLNGVGSFYHKCTLYKDDERIASTHCKYYNRTWEAYTYQTVMKKAVQISRHLTEEEKDNLCTQLDIQPKEIPVSLV